MGKGTPPSQKTPPSQTTPEKSISSARKLRNWFVATISSVFKTTSQKQLENIIYPFESIIDAAKDKAERDKDAKKEAIAECAKKMITEAKDALDRFEVQEAWGHYYEAELLSYQLMDDKMVKARASTILSDAEETLSGTDKENVHRLIGQARTTDGVWELKQNCSTEEVVEARNVIQTHYIDAYTNLGMALKQLAILALIAVVLIALIIFSLSCFANSDFTAANFSATNVTAANVKADNFTATDFSGMNFTATDVTVTNQVGYGNMIFLFSIALFGALGGTISAMVAVAKGSKGDTPERLFNSWLTVAKPIVGALAAVAITILLIGGIVQALSITTNYLFAMSIAAGFSERIVLGAIEKQEPSKESTS